MQTTIIVIALIIAIHSVVLYLISRLQDEQIDKHNEAMEAIFGMIGELGEALNDIDEYLEEEFMERYRESNGANKEKP